MKYSFRQIRSSADGRSCPYPGPDHPVRCGTLRLPPRPGWRPWEGSACLPPSLGRPRCVTGLGSRWVAGRRAARDRLGCDV